MLAEASLIDSELECITWKNFSMGYGGIYRVLKQFLGEWPWGFLQFVRGVWKGIIEGSG
jgi:hypothetical protein